MAEPDDDSTIPLGLNRHFVDVSAAEGEETTYDMCGDHDKQVHKN